MNPHDVCRTVFQKTLTSFQLDCVQSVLRGRDTFVTLRTGGGKTLIFTIAGYCVGGVCLVISPLVSLIRDQRAKLDELGIAHCLLQEASVYISKTTGSVPVFVYCTPESLLNMQDLPPLTQWKETQCVKLIVVDEAHCVWSWGPTFREAYLRCGYLRAVFPSAAILALTATGSAHTIRKVADHLLMRHPSYFLGELRRQNLYIKFLARNGSSPTDHKSLLQLSQFVQENNGSGLVFTLSRQDAEHTATYLAGCQVTSAAYHAGLSNASKMAVQDAWLSGHIQVVCCTIAFGMGIDKSDVRFVVHTYLPASLEEYAQEIGRAGRDNGASTCVTLWHPDDEKRTQQLWSISGYDREMRRNLDQMMLFAETTDGCRHQMLECEFGRPESSPCTMHCDLCSTNQDVKGAYARIDIRELVVAIRDVLPILRGCGKGQRQQVHTFIRATSTGLITMCKSNLTSQNAVGTVTKPKWNRVRNLVSRSLWAWGVLFQDGPEKEVFFDDICWKRVEINEELYMMRPPKPQQRRRKRALPEMDEQLILPCSEVEHVDPGH